MYNQQLGQIGILETVVSNATANGVALADDESFVRIAQTELGTIDQLWLKGEVKGKNDIFKKELDHCLPCCVGWSAIYPNSLRQNGTLHGNFCLDVDGSQECTRLAKFSLLQQVRFTGEKVIVLCDPELVTAALRTRTNKC